MRRAIEVGERPLQLDRGGFADRVELFRSIDADDRDRAALLDRNRAYAVLLDMLLTNGAWLEPRQGAGL